MNTFYVNRILQSCHSRIEDIQSQVYCFWCRYFNPIRDGQAKSSPPYQFLPCNFYKPLPDFIAFSTADIVPCVISGDDPLLSSKFVFIRENNGSQKSLNLSFIGLLTTSCLYASDKKRNVSFTAEKIKQNIQE